MQDLAIDPPPEGPSLPKEKPANTRTVRIGKRLRDPVNRWIARQSLIGDDPFVDYRALPGLAELGERWQDIRAELMPLLQEREAIPALGEIPGDTARVSAAVLDVPYAIVRRHLGARQAIPGTADAIVEDCARDDDSVIACGPDELPAGYAARRN